ncbi:hypothetical protein D3C78_654340 [compost metagenome]
MKKTLSIVILSYAAALIVYWISSPFIAMAVPTVVLFGALLWGGRGWRKAADRLRGQEEQPPIQGGQAGPTIQGAQARQSYRVPVGNLQGEPVAPQDQQPTVQAQTEQQAAPQGTVLDPELASAQEYIGILEDMILLEGEQNNLDDEIVQKTLALLARLNRLIPDLVALGDPTINHNIVRLVRRDLNSTINPFLRLSGEAKRQNRRLLLDGIKDVDSKLTFYTKTIEQKDLIELRTKVELMHQRYRLND